jgi:hypothetical protein
MNGAPVELVLVEFPGNEFKGEIVEELGRLVDAGTIRLIDALLIRKDADGSTQWLEAAEAGDSRLADLVGEPAGLLAEEDVEAIAADLEPNSSVGMMLFEHTWAAQLTGAIRRANGRLIDWASVPAAAIEELTSLIDKEG